MSAGLAAALAVCVIAQVAYAQTVTIKGRLYLNGYETKVRCDDTDGTIVGRTPFARSVYFGGGCPLSIDATDSGYFLFSGIEQQLSVGDPSDPTPKDALVFNGYISNAPVFGVMQGLAKDATTPRSERGTIAYVHETATFRSSFVGQYKASY